MWNWIYTNIDEILKFLSLLGGIGGMILWSHRGLHADIQEIRQDVKSAHARIDNLYNVMMAFLTKNKS